ncbi:hypothetical protein OIU74_027213 [Salix koriyanagi]|uniref:Uncharacterized protein n=1 Tax=Salix koriyanagi TaxID=2511006 RepID=A0A9Q1A4X6_9ROSI|nr:hypothetical protein OIU74_027213 [Salix koriyanagi]
MNHLLAPSPQSHPCHPRDPAQNALPILLIGWTALSKLTKDPIFNSIKEVFLKVSGDNPTVKSWLVKSVTVKQVPLTAILSPKFTPSSTVSAPILSSTPPSLLSPKFCTLPISSTMPVKRDLIG